MGIPAPREIISSVKTLKTPLAAISRGEIISSIKTFKTPLAAISRGYLPRVKKLKSFPKSSSDRERALSVQSRDEAETFTIVSRTRRA
jgi:hypothetical protein